MRIVLDLQGAQTVSRFRGIGRYSISLAKGIARQAGEHEIWICLNRTFANTLGSIRREFAGLLPPERIVAFDAVGPLAAFDHRNRWRQRASELLRGHFLEQLEPDVVYCLSMFEGWLDDAVGSVESGSSFRNVATLYDLIPLLNPEVYLAGDLVHDWYMEKLAALKSCDHLLAISGWSRREAMDALEYPASQITNISCAASEEFYPRNLSAAARLDLFEKFGINRPFLLYNGALEWRKNVDRLLEAFASLPASLRHDFELVVAGKSSAEDQRKLGRLASRLGIGDQVIIAGFVTDEELAGLYSSCTVFVFPSLHEGFGLPVLEAMSCGAAVVAANATSVPEAAGRQDALFDPSDAHDIARKIEHALSDPAYRASLQTHALEHSARFSWDASARAAIRALEKLVAGSQVTAKLSWTRFVERRDGRQQQLLNDLALIPAAADARSAADVAAVAVAVASNEEEIAVRLRCQQLPEMLRWRIEGPFDSSYSLALINRETARALHALGHDVSLYSTEGPGDFEPDAAWLARNPDVAALWSRALADVEPPQVCSRLLYPPRVTDMTAPLNALHHYAWEESGFPAEWAIAFNDSLHGISCLSRHVQKVLIDAGVTVPLTVSGCGTDHWDRIQALPMSGLTPGRFRFLHVSSCFPRKGVDVLLGAYGAAFQGRSDVELIIKTFDNKHNEIDDWLGQVQAAVPNFPPVVLITDDLSDAELKGLYESCDALVAPSRAEGFGLPLAEAMLSNLPVITTAWGGQLDFCDATTAWLVDYDFAAAETHFDLFGSVWAEPRQDSLEGAMQAVFSLTPAQRQKRAAAGAARLRESFTWRAATTRLVDAARSWSAGRLPKRAQDLRVGWVSTWGTKCGVAAYSQHLSEAMRCDITLLAPDEREPLQRDEENVVRCWTFGEDGLGRLEAEIIARDLDMVVVQLNYNFFNFGALHDLINRLADAGRAVVVELHSTTDQVGVPGKQLQLLSRALLRCRRLLVHSIGDMNRLKALGIIENVTLFPLGILDYHPRTLQRQVQSKRRWVLASYGFFLPNKGLIELIEAVAMLRGQGLDVHLRMANAEYPVAESAELIGAARLRIRELNLGRYVSLFTDFMSDEASLDMLSGADLVVFPYQASGESASGAVRFGIASGRPVAVTPLRIFDDVAPAVKRLPGATVAEIAQGIQQLLRLMAQDDEKSAAWQVQAERWREAHRYSRVGWRLENMLLALHQEAEQGGAECASSSAPISFATP